MWEENVTRSSKKIRHGAPGYRGRALPEAYLRS